MKLIGSIEKSHKILKLYMDDSSSKGITEISRLLNLPKTTIQSIVNTLTYFGYLEKDENGKYRLGPFSFQIGMKYASSLDLVTTGRYWALKLCEEFGQPVNFGMLMGNKAVIVMRVEPDQVLMSYPQVGSEIPLHSTCIGKLICAYIDDKKLNELLSNYTFHKFTENTITNKNNFMYELKKIKSSGISFDNQESVAGISGIGGPVFNHNGKLLLAFAVTGISEYIENNKNKIIQAVKHTSFNLSKHLGYNKNKY